MPTPFASVITPIDHSPDEIESRAELDDHLRRSSLAGLVVQGLAMRDVDLTGIDLTDALFVGCDLTDDQVVAAIRGGAHVVPRFDGLPYPTEPSGLYVASDLVAGFDTGGFEATFDTRVYRHFVAAGGANPPLREALAQRIHDHGIENAIAGATEGWVTGHGPGAIVGVMGGHTALRGTPGYRTTAQLTRLLARAGKLVLTGGGPGAMEAANLGAYLATRTPDELTAAIDELAQAPDYHQPDPYTAASISVHGKYPPPPDAGWEQAGGLSIPTWFFGHEPANLFPAQIGKLFSNAVREELILRLARGGILFVEGRAGTVQEVFQAANMTYYGSVNHSGPFVFLGVRFWTEELPVAELMTSLLRGSPLGDQTPLIHVTDDVEEAAALLIG